jgi:hypothetical protein
MAAPGGGSEYNGLFQNPNSGGVGLPRCMNAAFFTFPLLWEAGLKFMEVRKSIEAIESRATPEAPKAPTTLPAAGIAQRRYGSAPSSWSQRHGTG